MKAHAHLDLSLPHVRALVSFLKFLPGPVIFPGPSPSGPTPTCALLPQLRMFVVALNCTSADVSRADVDSLRGASRDTVMIRLGQPMTEHAFAFDVVLADSRHTDMRLHVSASRACRFVSASGAGDVIEVSRRGLVRCPQAVCSHLDSMLGRGRASAEMTMWTWGSRCFAAEHMI